MAYACINTDNLSGSYDGTNLVSFKAYEGSEFAELENGFLVTLDSLLTTEGEKEVWKAVAPAADAALEDIVLVANPELMYDSKKRDIAEYHIEKGEVCRGYVLRRGDRFSVTKEAFAGEAPTDTNKYITVAGAFKSLTAGSAADNARFQFLKVYTMGGKTWYKLKAM